MRGILFILLTLVAASPATAAQKSVAVYELEQAAVTGGTHLLFMQINRDVGDAAKAAETRKQVIEDAKKLDAAAPAAIEATKDNPALHAAVNEYYQAAASLLGSLEKTKAEQVMLQTKLDEKQAVLDREMKRAGFEK